jgi:hypothetical protein
MQILTLRHNVCFSSGDLMLLHREVHRWASGSAEIISRFSLLSTIPWALTEKVEMRDAAFTFWKLVTTKDHGSVLLALETGF